MGWMDDVIGDFDTPDEGWELLIDETCQNLLKDPQAVISSIEDLVEEDYPVDNADDFIYLINKYYVK